MTLQKGLDARIILIIVAVPLLKVFFCEVHWMTPYFLCADGTNNSDLYRHWIVTKNHSFSDLSFWQLIIVFEVIWIVVTKILLLRLVLRWHHHTRPWHHLWLERRCLLHLRHHRITHHLLRCWVW